MPSPSLFLWMFCAPVLGVSCIGLVWTLTSRATYARAGRVAAVVAVALACAYVAPALFAAVSGASLGLMVGSCIGKHLAFFTASTAAMLAIAVFCLLAQIATQAALTKTRR